MKLFLKLSVAGVFFLLTCGLTSAETVTFSEILLPDITPLTNQYSAFGLTFVNTYYAIDSRCAEDTYCIFQTANPATINFTSTVSGLSLDWLILDSSSFVATAYDASNNILSTFDSGPCVSPVCSGVVLLAGSDIASVVWHDHAGFVGIDSLKFTPAPAVPEPASLLLLASGLAAGLGVLRRRAALP